MERWYRGDAYSVVLKLINVEAVYWDTKSPELGVLTGTGTAHVVFHYDINGNEIGLKANIHLTNLTSSETGEVFLANVIQKNVNSTSDPDIIISRAIFILNGNMGTRIVCLETIEINMRTGEWVSLEHNHKQW